MFKSSLSIEPRQTPLYAGMIGVLLAALGWIAFGVGASEPADMTALEAQAQSLLRHQRLSAVAEAPLPASADAKHLLFATTTGAGAVAEIGLILLGIAKGPHDQAALISIDKAPPSWLTVGKSTGGVTLVAIGSSKVTVDTPLGFREVSLDGKVEPPEGQLSVAHSSPLGATEGRRP